MVVSKNKKARRNTLKRSAPKLLIIGIAASALAFLTIGSLIGAFNARFKDRIYPHVTVGGIPFGGKTPQEVETYWLSRNVPFANVSLEFHFEDTIATVSGTELDLGYDATLSATQAFLVGRSPYVLSNLMTKFFTKTVALDPYFRWNKQVVTDAVETVAYQVEIPVEDALFRFENGRVTAFRPSKEGRRVNTEETIRRFEQALLQVPDTFQTHVPIDLAVESISPQVTTDQVNNLGIQELIGRGYSEFTGSIPGRVHNIVLAASKLHGVLIPPGATLSFNETVGDISAATGYQSAYIIKDGRTILGDGGGVCQVSTTLFRAALAAGLPVSERHAHSYRVRYYELAGYKAGLDATVFAPSVDLKFTNDTPAYILIQAKYDTAKKTLAFELFGTRDGRVSQILNHQVWGISPPPPPLYQDDPTLPAGTTKQVDFPAWGAKATFRYYVVRNGETLQDKSFYSNFRPWQAVYLRGPQ
jgi:vancomycin resistance protein YoaR